MAQQLLVALGVAHDHGVVHRDVKPSNVMLGPGGRVTLTDFGIAQAADDPRLTTSGSIVGSPGYMSPERLEGGAATPASDLWALGATLFHATQGHGPFTRETTAATISAVLHAEIPPTRTRGPLGAVIPGCCSAPPGPAHGRRPRRCSPGAGPPSAADATTRPVTGRPPARPRRRSWPWVAAALVIGLLAGVAGGIAVARAADREVTTLTYGEGGDVPVFDVSGLDCLNVRPVPNDVVGYSASLSCDDAHLSEVFGRLEPFGTQRELPYPGREPLTAFASSACTLLFGSGLVVPQDGDALAVTALVPSQRSFEQNTGSGPSVSFGARDVYCLLRAADGSPLRGARVAEGAG